MKWFLAVLVAAVAIALVALHFLDAGRDVAGPGVAPPPFQDRPGVPEVPPRAADESRIPELEVHAGDAAPGEGRSSADSGLGNLRVTLDATVIRRWTSISVSLQLELDRTYPLWRSQPCDADGIALFTELPPGPVQVWICSAPVAESTVTAHETTEVVVDLPLREVTGTVLTREDRPCAEARVFVLRAGAIWLDRPVATTGPAGEFSFPTPEENAAVCALHPREGLSLPVTHRSTETEPLTLRLRGEQTAGVFGHVLDELDRPVSRAEVLMIPGSAASARNHRGELVASRLLLRQSTDSTGAFSGRGIGSGRWTLEVGAAGYARHVEELDLGGEVVGPLSVHLSRGGTVQGRVLESSGNTAARARVTVMDGERRILASGASASDGSFRVESVSPGEILVNASHPELGSSEDRRLELRVAETVELILQLTGACTLHGTVSDEHGSPLENMTLALFDSPATGVTARAIAKTDGAGAFAFRRCEADGRYDLVVQWPGDRRMAPLARVEATSCRDSPVGLTVDRAGLENCWISGSIVGVPAEIRDLTMRVTPLGSEVGWSLVLQDSADRFRVGPLGPGTYRLDLRGRFVEPLDLGELELKPGEVLDLGPVHLRAAASVAVHLEFDGDPGWLQCRLRRKEEDSAAGGRMLSIAGKVATGSGIPPGDYELVVVGREVQDMRRDVTVLAGLENRFSVELVAR